MRKYFAVAAMLLMSFGSFGLTQAANASTPKQSPKTTSLNEMVGNPNEWATWQAHTAGQEGILSVSVSYMASSTAIYPSYEVCPVHDCGTFHIMRAANGQRYQEFYTVNGEQLLGGSVTYLVGGQSVTNPNYTGGPIPLTSDIVAGVTLPAKLVSVYLQLANTAFDGNQCVANCPVITYGK